VVKNRALPIAMPGMVILGSGLVQSSPSGEDVTIKRWLGSSARKAIHKRPFTAAIAGALPIEKCVVLARYARNSG
jgi:hypothetical protein